MSGARRTPSISGPAFATKSRRPRGLSPAAAARWDYENRLPHEGSPEDGRLRLVHFTPDSFKHMPGSNTIETGDASPVKLHAPRTSATPVGSILKATPFTHIQPDNLQMSDQRLIIRRFRYPLNLVGKSLVHHFWLEGHQVDVVICSVRQQTAVSSTNTSTPTTDMPASTEQSTTLAEDRMERRRYRYPLSPPTDARVYQIWNSGHDVDFAVWSLVDANIGLSHDDPLYDHNSCGNNPCARAQDVAEEQWRTDTATSAGLATWSGDAEPPAHAARLTAWAGAAVPVPQHLVSNENGGGAAEATIESIMPPRSPSNPTRSMSSVPANSRSLTANSTTPRPASRSRSSTHNTSDDTASSPSDADATAEAEAEAARARKRAKVLKKHGLDVLSNFDLTPKHAKRGGRKSADDAAYRPR